MEGHLTPGASARPPANLARGSTPPSSSRMLTRYLTDIEELLEHQHWEAALREARDLPQIVVALADPALHSSAEAVTRWGERWIAPEERTTALVAAALQPSFAESSTAAAVPTRALRRLQLRRHVRTAPRGYPLEAPADLAPAEREAIDTARSLVQSARLWYAHSGCHDSTVQANLARLAVLR